MAKRLSRDEATFLLVYLTAWRDFKEGGWFGIGEGDLITNDELKYLEVVKTTENLKIDDDISYNHESQRVSVHGTEVAMDGGDELWTRCCKVMKSAGKNERLKTVAYMVNMADVSQEDDKENNISDYEMDLILQTADELDVSFEEVVDAMQGDDALVPFLEE